MTPSLGGFLTPINPIASNEVREVSASYIPLKKFELLNKINGQGLKVEYRFTRSQHLVSSVMVSIELSFTNETKEPIENVHIGNKVISKDINLSPDANICELRFGCVHFFARLAEC